MNILLTSAGRRTYIVEYFKEALKGEGLVFASNSCMSPALMAADKYFLTPYIYEEGYIDFLIEKCRKLDISMVIPLFDLDVSKLSENKEIFKAEGIDIAVSDPKAAETCSDKYLMFLRLCEKGINCPITVTDIDEAILRAKNRDFKWPVIVKPRFGMGSIGIFKAYDENELKAAFSMCRRSVLESYVRYGAGKNREDCVIVQEIAEGSEYGMDVVCGLDGTYLTTIVRKKLAMRAGETDEAIVLGENAPEFGILSKLGGDIAKALNPAGILDADIIMGRDYVPYVIDLNARFGGGYPFSHLAGANVPKAYLLMKEGKNKEALKYLKVKPGTHGYKEITIKGCSY